MEWLNDPKNRPIVIGVFCVILLVTAFIGYKTFFAGSGGGGEEPVATETTTPPPGAGAPPMTPGAPGAPGAPMAGAPPTPGAPGAPAAAPGTPGAAPAAAPGTPAAPAAGTAPKPATVAKLEKFRDDPFLPLDWVDPKVKPKEVVHIPMPGRMFAARIENDILKREEPEMPQPPRRMAGILFNERVYAIIERNGPGGAATMIVKPGDITDDGMRVERIEPNKVVLVTTTGKQRRVDVKMAASQNMGEQMQQQQPGGMGGPRMPMPGGPYMGGRRGGPMLAPMDAPGAM